MVIFRNTIEFDREVVSRMCVPSDDVGWLPEATKSARAVDIRAVRPMSCGLPYRAQQLDAELLPACEDCSKKYGRKRFRKKMCVGLARKLPLCFCLAVSIAVADAMGTCADPALR